VDHSPSPPTGPAAEPHPVAPNAIQVEDTLGDDESLEALDFWLAELLESPGESPPWERAVNSAARGSRFADLSDDILALITGQLSAASLGRLYSTSRSMAAMAKKKNGTC